MSTLNISVSELSLTEKLSLMEDLWDELSRKTETLESPAWHQNILDERAREISAGQANVSDWESAKQRIRQQTV